MQKLTAVIFTCMLSFYNASGENLFYITNVSRTIDLTNEFVGVEEKFTFRNIEDTPGTHFVYTIVSKKSSLVYLTARGGEDRSYKLLWYKEKQLDDILAFSVALDKPVEPGGTSSIVIETAFRDQLVQGDTLHLEDESRVRYIYAANQYVYSPYHIRHQTTKILSRDQENETSFKDKKPFSTSPLVFEMWETVNHILEMDEYAYMLCEHKVREYILGDILFEDALNSCSETRPPGPVTKDQWDYVQKPSSCLIKNIAETCASPKSNFTRNFCKNHYQTKEEKKEKEVLGDHHKQVS